MSSFSIQQIHAQIESQGHVGSVVNGTASGCLARHWSSLVDVASRSQAFAMFRSRMFKNLGLGLIEEHG